MEDILAEDGNEMDTPTEASLLLVTELRGSLTGLDRHVKAYSFLPLDEQLPKIVVDSCKSSESSLEKEGTFSAEVTGNSLLAGSGKKAGDENPMQHPHNLVWPDNSEEDQLCFFTGDDMGMFADGEMERDSFAGGDIERDTFTGGDMDTFATDMFTTFESNLLKYRTQSLPDFFSNPPILYDGSDDDDDDRLTGRSVTSSGSTSTVSILNSSKDSVLEDSYTNGKHSPHSSKFNGNLVTRSADMNECHPHAELPDINGHDIHGLTGEPLNGAESGSHSESPPSHSARRQDSNVSSETYESAESEISKSRPDTPISPQRRLTASLDESRYGKSRVRKQSDDRLSSSSVSTSGGRHSFSSRHEDILRSVVSCSIFFLY